MAPDADLSHNDHDGKAYQEEAQIMFAYYEKVSPDHIEPLFTRLLGTTQWGASTCHGLLCAVLIGKLLFKW